MDYMIQGVNFDYEKLWFFQQIFITNYIYYCRITYSSYNRCVEMSFLLDSNLPKF